MNNKKLFSIFVFTFFIDRITKYLAMNGFFNEISFFDNFLSFGLFFNKGISWSLFETNNIHKFYFIIFLILLIITYLCIQIRSKILLKASIFGEILVLSGGLSNIVDRLLYNGVIDFIILTVKNYTWPIFNIADICIVLGVILIFVNSK